MKNINIKIIISFLGLTSMLNGLFMLLAVPISIYYGESEKLGILKAGITTVIIGFLLWFFNRNAKKNLGKKEGYLIVTLGWLMLTLTGTLPYVYTETIPIYTNAFFETISGYSTTGSSILTDIESMPKGILFWRSATHWIGGMGIIVL
ncbi:MAG: TrkH family potassium uptake protein, partial [Bacteroidetes bacterium]|nr:TrkH family potassium uptake protein [Bacteroidota bacterium]